jgi:hypothetical protein
MQTSTTKPRSLRGLPLLLGLAALGIIQPRAQAQTVIYSDTFARGTVEMPIDLKGSSPDTTSGLYGGTSGATWTAKTGDWIMAGAGAAAQRDCEFASLPFTPLPSTVYTVDWTWTVGSGTPWWIIGLQTAWDHMTVTGNVRNSIIGTNHAVVTLITDATTGYTAHVVFNGATPWPDTFGLRSAITRIGFIQQAGGSNTAVMTSMSLSVADAAPTPSTTALVRNPLNPLATSTYGDSLSFDVTVAEDGGLGIPSGSVILKDGTTAISGAIGLDETGKCTITTSALAAGEYSGIVAVYGGDPTYAGSTSSTLSTQTVGPKPLTVTATGPAKPFGTVLSTGPSTINFTADPTGVGSEAVTSVTLTPDAAGLSSTTPVGDPYTVTPSLATGSNGFLESNYNITYIAYDGTVTEAPPPPPAGTIYLDTFARSGDLNGSTPDFSSGLDGGTSGATWSATTGDWIMNGAGASAQRDCRFAWLPFSPVANTVYTLDWTWTVGGGTPWWMIGLQTAWDHNTVGGLSNSLTGFNHAVVTITTDGADGYTTHTVYNGTLASAVDTSGSRSAITCIGFIQQAGGSNTTIMTSMSLSVGGTPPAVTYADWAAAYAGGGAPNEDANKDGVQNANAYFMNATGVATNPGITGNTVTWINGSNIPSSAYGTQFVVQTSSDLVSWADVPNDASDTNLSNTAGSVSYTLPKGVAGGKIFVRLMVTPN